MQNRLLQLEEFISKHDQAGVAAWCEQLCYWFDPGGWFGVTDFGKWLGDKASVTEEDKFNIDCSLVMNNLDHINFIPKECSACKWVDKGHLYCEKTGEYLLHGCVCDERFGG